MAREPRERGLINPGYLEGMPAEQVVGVDVSRREIWISGGIGEGFSSHVIQALREMQRLRSDASIDIFINSPGGDPVEALSVCDYIAHLNETLVIRTNVIGTAYSAAALISSAGRRGFRYALPSSDFLIHQLYADVGGEKISALEDTTRHLTRLNTRIRDHLVMTSQFPTDAVDDWMEKESYFGTNEAIDHGLCDRVFGRNANEH